MGKLRLEVGTFYRLISSKLFTSLASTWIFWRGSLRKGLMKRSEWERTGDGSWGKWRLSTGKRDGFWLIFSQRARKGFEVVWGSAFLWKWQGWSDYYLINWITLLWLVPKRMKISLRFGNPENYELRCKTTILTSLTRSSANLCPLQSLQAPIIKIIIKGGDVLWCSMGCRAINYRIGFVIDSGYFNLLTLSVS